MNRNTFLLSVLFTLLAGSSFAQTTITGIINDYTPATGFNACTNELVTDFTTAFKAGDTVMIIQMKGAGIDSSNSANFGKVLNYRNSGLYELNYVTSATNTQITLKNKLANAYDFNGGYVQLIRVPYYQSAVVAGTLTCPPWDGRTGGVVVLNVKDTITLQGNIDVSGKGFRGGVISNNPDGACGIGSPDYFYPLTQPGFSWTTGGAEKGEGIAEVTAAKRAGKGSLANGGGGGNKHNTGGGGGSNYSVGGKGGNELAGCTIGGNGGIGGQDMRIFSTIRRIFMGGGGGRGDDNNRVGTVGANGGGIVFMLAAHLKGNGNTVSANGNSQLTPGTGIADGAGGGGGGGAIIMGINTYSGTATVEAKGGKGGDQQATFGCVGTGGGGGGGAIFLKGTVAQAAGLNIMATGGNPGVFTTVGYPCTNSTYGATKGSNGDTVQNLAIVTASIPFRINIDSVRFKDTALSCANRRFEGQAFVNTAAIASWKWTFGDGGTANTQNATHLYTAPGSYFVQLVVTDINGCADSIASTIIIGVCTSTCNDWLYTPSYPSSVNIGDLDVTGNQLTVEASYNSTALSANGSWGHIVSKHTNAGNVNYAISPNGAEITTTISGYTTALQTCPVVLNKTYHTAMVYNGVSLKFYRNGYLMSETPCTGNLVTNDLLTTIGQIAGPVAPGEQFTGYINEVRIWNKVRTQDELRAYMNTPLINPSAQTGLLGYYTFNNLLNKQGNASYNATLQGSATSNVANPNCSFVADSCPVVNQVTHIINDYTPLTAFDACTNQLTAESTTAFKAGDTVLIIQMKGAAIDSSNSSNFGSITDFRSSGFYEFNYIQGITGNNITLKNTLTKSYDFAHGRVQLVRVPYYQQAVVTGTLTCLPWDGRKGGVLVLNVKDTVNLQGNIDVNGKGFRGGVISNNPDGGCGTGSPGYFYPLTQPGFSWDSGGAEKGEGIAEVSDAKRAGKGALANGGGGGNKHNTGGGGGSNYSTGGKGGNELDGCGVTANGGLGGKNLRVGNPRLFLGGGGGRGDDNNGVGTAGADGGGIIFLMARHLKGNGNTVSANGNSQLTPGTGIADGAGGGGGGGGIVLGISSYSGTATVEAKGGKGGDQIPFYGCVGTGGGGGGGAIFLTGGLSQANSFTLLTTGGAAGDFLAQGFSCYNTTYGATNGGGGDTLQNLIIPVATIPFRRNIDSVRFTDTALSCSNYRFEGEAFTNSAGIAGWQWTFGDGGTAATQNATHQYTSTGLFTVTLKVTDENGCTDSVSRQISTDAVTAVAAPDTTICTGGSSIVLRGNGGSIYAWSPATLLNDSTLQNPTATINSTTTFYLRVFNSARTCSSADTITITVGGTVPDAPPDRFTCTQQPVTLLGNNGPRFRYLWSPATNLSNPATENPVCTPAATTPYTVTLTDTVCNVQRVFPVTVVVQPSPVLTLRKSNDVDCAQISANLQAGGAVQYLWSPSAGLSNPNLPNPVATPGVTTTYVVRGQGLNGCTAKDSITVNVSNTGKALSELPNAFTPNNDGINDCFGPNRFWGDVRVISFTVFNRYGETVFYSTRAGDCWNGRFKGAPALAGAYVYYIKASGRCGTVERKGTVILVR